MKNKITEAVLQERLIVILRGIKKEKLIPLAEAMYAGGVRLLEVTYSASGEISDEETAARIGMLCEHFGERMQIGAGTVLCERQVELTARAGGSFIISPDCNTDVIKKTVSLGLCSMPGCLTPTEVLTAHRAGADFIKLFPITSLGCDYVKAIRAPLSHVKLLAVGGVDLDNMENYLRAGVCGFGIGSNIVDKKMLAEEDYDGIANLARRYVHTAKGDR